MVAALLPVLATSVAYAVYLSTPLGREPGGEYTHISRTFGGHGVAFVGAWLKIISYVGRARLPRGRASPTTLVELFGRGSVPLASAPRWRWRASSSSSSCTPRACAGSARMQVAMCALLGAFGGGARRARPLRDPTRELPAVLHRRRRRVRGQPAAAVLPYAGFESLAQAAGEVKDSTRRLPAIFLRGLAGHHGRLRAHVGGRLRRLARVSASRTALRRWPKSASATCTRRRLVRHPRRGHGAHHLPERDDAGALAPRRSCSSRDGLAPGMARLDLALDRNARSSGLTLRLAVGGPRAQRPGLAGAQHRRLRPRRPVPPPQRRAAAAASLNPALFASVTGGSRSVPARRGGVFDVSMGGLVAVQVDADVAVAARDGARASGGRARS